MELSITELNWNATKIGIFYFFLILFRVEYKYNFWYGIGGLILSWSVCYTHYMLCCIRYVLYINIYVYIPKMIQRFYVEHDTILLGECTNYITPFEKRKTICHCQVGCQTIRKCWISGFATFVMICLSSNCVCVCSESMYTLGSIVIYQRYLIACFLNGVKEHPYGKL